MDQDSFRKLLETSQASSSKAASNTWATSSSSKSKKTINASEPAFKPRKVKKSEKDGKFRDRAAERRAGTGNDYAQVEAVLEDFEQRTAANEDRAQVEQQRRYLGGDADHSVLVKGLDSALLEQHKAPVEDDDSLEQAFIEVSAPKKRTREDIVKELKDKRQKDATGNEQQLNAVEVEARTLEEAKKAGKFKPIGFKPIGASTEGTKRKKTKEKDGVERKKKKRKVENSSEMQPPPTPPAPAPQNPIIPTPVDEPLDDDFDIFPSAGEYQGLGVGDDDDEEEEEEGEVDLKPDRHIPVEQPNAPRALWFAPGESLQKEPPPAPRKIDLEEPVDDQSDDEDETPMRLVPLASSSVPSIKELLAMDKAAGAKKGGNKRKGKGGGKGKGKEEDEEGDKEKKMSAEERADRDYKRLKAYTDKKGLK